MREINGARVRQMNGAPVLVAPDSFKGSFSAELVARAIARGLGSRGVAGDLCPVADGGEGTLRALSARLGAELRRVTASDPLGRPLEAQFALAAGSTRRRGATATATATAIVEVAAASGFNLVASHERDAIAASSYGTGELIVAAITAGAGWIYLGAGGSATSDGGAGAIRAIEDAGGLRGARLVVLCDVRTPFEQAARVFGPQKGASADDVLRLSERLDRLAVTFARDPRGLPMTGAAGGLSGGLWAALGAELVAGAPFVLDAIGFDERMRAARAVVTGEGCLDRQSLSGKAVSEVATRARQSGVPCHAIVGRSELDAFGLRILDIEAVLEAGTIEELERAGARLAELL